LVEEVVVHEDKVVIHHILSIDRASWFPSPATCGIRIAKVVHHANRLMDRVFEAAAQSAEVTGEGTWGNKSSKSDSGD
jgi:hypothetical protein